MKGCPKITSNKKCPNTNCGKNHKNWYPCGWKVEIGSEIVEIVGEDGEADDFGLSLHDFDDEKIPAAKEGKNEKEVQAILDKVTPGTLTEL